ncbi:TonB-dependent receptor [Sulfidibacter corallicola]|uniref:TonB-dependent receptor n=1 Tax=Sulfidibacter corallicola TaxID=2818388 RepID=A0A8A4TL70_SULCO|nr:TonB-dependent receptor [Sulfidibacter corallicola]QTD50290.1 TonB-dependent receptor [Sulfidibacter corallicola]
MSIAEKGSKALLLFTMTFLSIVAQEGLEFDDLDDMTLEELLNMEIVSATRSSSKLSESPIPISVITAQDIAQSGLDSIPAVLSRLAEIDVLEIGTSQTEVSIRGKNINFNRRLLVLIDGRTEYNDLFGVTLWHAFPIGLNDIERIEVVRGPASALFGANAFSGVINIITKAVDGDRPSVLHLAAGSESAQNAHLFYRHHKGKFGLKASGGVQTAESHETEVAFPGFIRIPTTYNFQGDDDSLDMTRGTLSLNWGPREGLDFKLSAGFSDGELELFPQPGLPREDWDVETTHAHLTVDYQTTAGGMLQLAAYFNGFEYETPLLPTTESVLSTASEGHTFYPSLNEATLFEGSTDTFDVSLQYVGHAMKERFNYVLGLESRTIENDGGLVANSDKDIHSAFANFTYRLTNDHWMIGAGIRVDDDSITDQDIGYTASVLYFPSDTLNIRLSARRAFRAPSLFELFSNIEFNVPRQNNLVRFEGNPNLEVETIENLDLTVTAKLGKSLQLTAELFFEEYQDLIGNPDSGLLADIEFDSENLFTTTTSFQNLSDADNLGLQLGLVWVVSEHASLHANTIWLDPSDLNDLSGETFFTPEYKVNLGWHWRHARGFLIQVDAHYVAETDEEEFKEGDVSPQGPNFTRENQESYTIVNLKLAHSFKALKGLEIYAASRNLLDEDYVAYYEFDTVLKASGERFGREVEGGLSWRF